MREDKIRWAQLLGTLQVPAGVDVLGKMFDGETLVEWKLTVAELRPAYRIKIRTACRSGVETSSKLVGSLQPGDEISAVKEAVNSAGVRRMFIRQRRDAVGPRRDGMLAGWISNKPSIVKEIDGLCGGAGASDSSDVSNITVNNEDA